MAYTAHSTKNMCNRTCTPPHRPNDRFQLSRSRMAKTDQPRCLVHLEVMTQSIILTSAQPRGNHWSHGSQGSSDLRATILIEECHGSPGRNRAGNEEISGRATESSHGG